MDGDLGAAVLREFDGVLDRLEGYARDLDFTRFATEGIEQDGVLRAMTLAGQCAIDLALMIVAHRRLGTPPTCSEAFLALARAGVIPPAIDEPLERWASIRNVIVHLYTKLDLERLYRAYTAETSVLREFRALAAKTLLESPGVPGPSGPSRVRERRAPYGRTKPRKARKAAR